MKLINKVIIMIFVSLTLLSCYTIIKHPEIERDGYTQRVKFYNDCSSCHSEYELENFGLSFHSYSSSPYYNEPVYIYTSPYYTSPWWRDIYLSSEPNIFESRNNDATRLRNQDGGRSSAPSTFSSPSINASGQTSGSSSSGSSNQVNDRKEERRSRESETPKSRNNSGERKR